MARQIVIGGGAIGLSVAYHLAKRGTDEVILLERNQLGSGTSWHAAGIVGPLRASPKLTQLAMYAGELFPQLEAATGQSTGYRQTGGYWLARKPERMDELQRLSALGRHFGLSVDILGAAHTQDALPFLDLQSHSGSMSVAQDANVNPVDLIAAYAKGAKAYGVVIREHCAVADILVSSNQVVGVQLNDGSTLEATQVALCCGAWSKPLAQRAGLHLPLQAVEHMYVVTEPVSDLPNPFPVIRDLDSGIYIKGDAGGKLVVGGFESNAKCWDPFAVNGDVPFLEFAPDWAQFEPFMEAAITLCPALKSIGIAHFMNGPESFTNDTKPLLGQAPNTSGLFVAAGMNSVGVMSSAGIGRVLAEWMIDGIPSVDLWEVDVARVDPKAADTAHMQKRMQEAVSDQFALHWPFKQPAAGRGLRTSPLHQEWQQLGAVFGVTAGWERGLWYAKDTSEKKLPYSVNDQPWQPIAEREARQLAQGTVLLDLSPFSKFDVQGSDALVYLEQLTCGAMDMNVGSVIYTLILNTAGGIEADVTVSRYAENHFRLTSGAATRWRDNALLLRSAAGFAVTITDVTEEETVIGVMGQGSRTLLASLSNKDLLDFDYATTEALILAGHCIRATRLSYIGELGWELYIPNNIAATLFHALVDAGAAPMGHYALESCRIEKGFKHWGHDLGPELTPLHASLAFTVNWNKAFTGHAALKNAMSLGVTSKLCLFSVEGRPLMLHDEPILEHGKVVGLTTSGTQGVRTGLTLAFGLIDILPDENIFDTAKRQFEINVAGKRYPATVLTQAPFDPSGSRMRA